MSQVSVEYPFGDPKIEQRATDVMPFRGGGLPAAASWIAIAAALLALMPLVSLVVIALGGETGDIWAHLIRYVIPIALWQTASAAGRRRRRDGDRRRRHRLGGHHLLVSGSRRADLAAAVAARHSDLHRGLRLRRHPRRARTGAVGAARDVRLAVRRRLLVSECPLARRRGLRHRLRALPVRLSRRARDVPDPGGAARRGRADARRAAMAAGARASRCRWRGRPSRSALRSRCSKRSTTSAPANISACRP